MVGFKFGPVITDEVSTFDEQIKQEATDILGRGLSLPFNWRRFDEEDFLKRESASKVGKPRSAKNRAKSRADGKKARAARRNNR